MKFLEDRYQALVGKYYETGKSPLPCTALSSSCFIDAYWNLYACSIWDAKVGNLRENAFDLRALWDSDRRRELRDDVVEERCSHCWTPCEAYPTILGNLARAAVSRGAIADLTPEVLLLNWQQRANRRCLVLAEFSCCQSPSDPGNVSRSWASRSSEWSSIRRRRTGDHRLRCQGVIGTSQPFSRMGHWNATRGSRSAAGPTRPVTYAEGQKRILADAAANLGCSLARTTSPAGLRAHDLDARYPDASEGRRRRLDRADRVPRYVVRAIDGPLPAGRANRRGLNSWVSKNETPLKVREASLIAFS